MRMPSRRRSSFSRTIAATAARVGARNANTSSRLKAAAASTAPASKRVSGHGKGFTCRARPRRPVVPGLAGTSAEWRGRGDGVAHEAVLLAEWLTQLRAGALTSACAQTHKCHGAASATNACVLHVRNRTDCHEPRHAQRALTLSAWVRNGWAASQTPHLDIQQRRAAVATQRTPQDGPAQDTHVYSPGLP
jgi:hypothetical protein